jgi:peptidoglycan-associated lipoprotein
MEILTALWKFSRHGMWIAAGGLAVLMIGGCSTNSGMSTADDATLQDSSNTAREGGRQPLTGFSKSPSEESVSGSGPLDGRKDAAKESQAAAERRAREAGLAQQNTGMQLFDIYFPFDRWGIVEEERKSLVASAEYLKAHPKARLVVEGYCDERGTGEYNLVLGEKRAKEARQFLLDLGVKNKVSVKSYGKERGVCTERTESCYRQNRRAHLTVPEEPKAGAARKEP